MGRDISECEIHGEYMEFGPHYNCPQCQDEKEKAMIPDQPRAEIQRYDITVPEDSIYPCDDGAWVIYEDHARIVSAPAPSRTETDPTIIAMLKQSNADAAAGRLVDLGTFAPVPARGESVTERCSQCSRDIPDGEPCRYSAVSGITCSACLRAALSQRSGSGEEAAINDAVGIQLGEALAKRVGELTKERDEHRSAHDRILSTLNVAEEMRQELIAERDESRAELARMREALEELMMECQVIGIGNERRNQIDALLGKTVSP